MPLSYCSSADLFLWMRFTHLYFPISPHLEWHHALLSLSLSPLAAQICIDKHISPNTLLSFVCVCVRVCDAGPLNPFWSNRQCVCACAWVSQCTMLALCECVWERETEKGGKRDSWDLQHYQSLSQSPLVLCVSHPHASLSLCGSVLILRIFFGRPYMDLTLSPGGIWQTSALPCACVCVCKQCCVYLFYAQSVYKHRTMTSATPTAASPMKVGCLCVCLCVHEWEVKTPQVINLSLT